MYCVKCGKLIRDDAVFCDGCGAKVSNGRNDVAKESVPTCKESWMLLAVKEEIKSSLKNPESARFSQFEQIETDQYGRTYAEIVVFATFIVLLSLQIS